MKILNWLYRFLGLSPKPPTEVFKPLSYWYEVKQVLRTNVLIFNLDETSALPGSLVQGLTSAEITVGSTQVEISIFDPEFHLYHRWTQRLKLGQVYLLQIAGSEDVVAYLSFVLCRESSDTNTRLVFSKWRL